MKLTLFSPLEISKTKICVLLTLIGLTLYSAHMFSNENTARTSEFAATTDDTKSCNKKREKCEQTEESIIYLILFS